MSTNRPNLFSIEDAPNSGFEVSDTGDPMAAANVRMAIANVPRPANPIPSQANYAPIVGQAAADVAGTMAKSTAQGLWDTSIGAAVNAYNRGFGPPVTPQQLEAHARLKAAIPNSILNYALSYGGEPAAQAVKRAPNLTGRLLNASADITPETLQNLKTVESGLIQAGPPKIPTQAGMAEHLKGLSLDIQNQIAPVIEANAEKDVSGSTAQIAQDLRSQITPAMKRTNPGVANTLERFAKTAEDTKTLKGLDEFRQQLENRKNALQPTSIGKPYVFNALNSVLDAIADHVDEANPGMGTRALRTQQKAYMQLSNVFEQAGQQGQALKMAKEAMTPAQKGAQSLQDLLQLAYSPKTALAKRFLKPATAEEMIQRAYAGYGRGAGSMVQSVTGNPTPGMSSLDMENLIRGGGENTAEQAQIQALREQAAEKARSWRLNKGVAPNAPVPNAQVPEWPAEYQNAPKTLSSEGGGGANYSAEDLAALKKRLGIE